MNRRHGFVITLVAFFLALPCSRLNAAPWLPFGPNGGDAREFASDPKDSSHLYLGTATGWMYESHDRGRSWKRLALIGNRDDLVLDSISVEQMCETAERAHVLDDERALGDSAIFMAQVQGA